MIEVEIRGKLDDQQYQNLKEYLVKHGGLKEKHDREMYLLYDYPGYDNDPTKRTTDIRLRNTSGFCEIMLKVKASEGNRARKEISLGLKDANLDKAKEIVKALGCKRALKMERSKEIYELDGVEWSLVTCPKGIRYYEAEKEVASEGDIEKTEKELFDQAKKLGVPALNHNDMREFIYWLDEQVNVEIDL